MIDLTTNIPRLRKNVLGSINKVYLFGYVKYSRSQITVLDQTLTVFPATTIYSTHSIGTSFNENTETEGGDVFYNQSFSVEFPMTAVTSEVYKFAKVQWRAIYVDYLSNIRILGLYNGLDATVSNEPGSDKSSFNGYKVAFTGKESNQAYFIDDLSAIFTHYVEPPNKIFMNGCNAVMQNSNNYIYN